MSPERATRRLWPAMLAILAGGYNPAASLTGRVLDAHGHPMADAVVFVDGVRTGTPPRRHPMLDQRHRTFIPHVMAVLIGTTVRFPNHDTVFHNVFSVRDGKRFDLGLYPAGTQQEKTFDRPGLIRIFCNIHSNMSAFIWVLPNPYFAITGRDGRYQIQGVPPGRYVVRAWHEPADESRAEASVPPSGIATLDLALGHQ